MTKVKRPQAAAAPVRSKAPAPGSKPPPAAAQAPPPAAANGEAKPKAKSKSKKGEWTHEVVVQRRSSLQQSMVDLVRTRTGSLMAATGKNLAAYSVGLLMPFPLQYLLQINVFPLGGTMMQIAGAEGTCKSGLLFEFGRLFRLYGGWLDFIENESKFSADWADSIMGWPDEHGGEVFYNYYPTGSTEEWQNVLQLTTKGERAMMADKKGPGRIYPVLKGLDSIMGKLSVDTQAKIESAGYAGRSHPYEALQITNFLKKYINDIMYFPMAFIGINHLKVKKTESGPLEKNKAGGKHISFQETFEIEPSWRGDITLEDEDPDAFETGGVKLHLKCIKNSLGNTRKSIDVNVIWRNRPTPTPHFNPDTGAEEHPMRQYTVWDWSSATVDLLLTGWKGKRKELLMQCVDIHPVAAGKGGEAKADAEADDKKAQPAKLFWSKRLGVPKDQPVPKAQLGAMIQANSGVMRSLQNLLGVHRGKVFQPGVDFMRQVMEHKARVDKEANKL